MRAVFSDHADEAREWSAPLYFGVPELPSEQEVAEALAVLERWQAGRAEVGGEIASGSPPARAPAPAATPDRPAPPPREVPLAGGPAAIRGEMTDTTGSVHGVFGITHSPDGTGVVARNEAGGADLILDGAAQGQTDTVLTELGLDRASAAVESFDFGNSGAGAMTLTIDGAEVVTVLTDQDTLGGLSCGSAQVAKRIGGVWSCAADLDTLGGLGCGEGQLAKRIGGVWTCAADEGQTYSAGNQLELVGTTFNVLEGPGSGLDADTLDGLQGAAFAPATHPHAGEDIVSGLVAEPRIAASLARDAEIFPTVLANDGAGSTLDADLLDGLHALSFATLVHNHAGEQIVSGTVADARIAAAIARDTEILPTVLANDGSGSTLDADLLDGQDSSTFQPRIMGVCPPGTAMQGVDPAGGVVCAELHIPPRITTLTLSPPGDVGYYSSIAIGLDGLPVIAYRVEAGPTKTVAVVKCNDPACDGRNETQWVINSGTNDWGQFLSMAIGTDGFPVVSFYDDTLDRLMVLKCNDPACAGADETVSTVDASPLAGWWTSIAIGVDGLPVISYQDQSAQALKVAKCNDPACSGGDESISVVDQDFPRPVGAQPSLAIGSDGLPVIAYHRDIEVWVAKCNDPGCVGGNETLSPLDSPDATLHYPRIAIGTDGLPVVAYRYTEDPVYALRVAKCNDPACSGGDETMTDVDLNGSWISIAIGSDGYPVISHAVTGLLRVVKCNDVACAGSDETLTTVDGPGSPSLGWYSSIAIGADGLPIISYQETDIAAGRAVLRVAKCLSASCGY